MPSTPHGNRGGVMAPKKEALRKPVKLLSVLRLTWSLHIVVSLLGNNLDAADHLKAQRDRNDTAGPEEVISRRA
jgi:hypothetical protein